MWRKNTSPLSVENLESAKTALQEFRKAALRVRSRVPQFTVMSLVWGFHICLQKTYEKPTKRAKNVKINNVVGCSKYQPRLSSGADGG